MLYWSLAENRVLYTVNLTSNCVLSSCLPSWGVWCLGEQYGWGLHELYPATRGGIPGHRAGSYPWTEGRSSTPHSAAHRTNKLCFKCTAPKPEMIFAMHWVPFLLSTPLAPHKIFSTFDQDDDDKHIPKGRQRCGWWCDAGMERFFKTRTQAENRQLNLTNN